MNPTAGMQNRLKPVGGALRNLIYQVLGSSGGFESAFAKNLITGLICQCSSAGFAYQRWD
jgi:hypothetical protein